MAKGKKKENRSKLLPILILVIGLAVIGLILTFSFNSDDTPAPTTEIIDSVKQKQIDEKKKQDFINASTATDDSNTKVIRMSEPVDPNVPYQLDQNAGKTVRRIFNGRRINIAITGLDSRMGTHSNHADANHVLSILIDSGVIELTTIPRDTPADAGMPDSTLQNKLTIVRAVKGREAYHKELADIAGLDKIHYYIELSFSQAMGIIELFGFKDSKSALQVLRSRTGLGGDDYQRCYNQAQFIRQMTLRNFNKLTGVVGEVLIRGGFALVETNLTVETLKNIRDRLKVKGFPKNPDDITIRVRPPMGMNFKVFDFTDESVFQSLRKKIERFNEETGKKDTIEPVNIYYRLRHLLSNSARDTAKKPDNVIRALTTYFDQHAWLQISNLQNRDSIREQFAVQLINAYSKKKQYAKAARVRDIINAEKNVLLNPVNKN